MRIANLRDDADQFAVAHHNAQKLGCQMLRNADIVHDDP